MNAATEFDLGPLTWVKGEIDLALEKADEALKQCSATSDATQLKFCRTHVHQVQGALAIVGLDGVTQVIDSLEALLLAIEEGKTPASREALALIGQAIAALRQYLDDLMAGEPNQPLRLLPTYRALAGARSASPANPTDLFHPDLSLRPPRRQPVEPRSLQEQQSLIKNERARFQKGLLAWLKKPDAADAGIELMRAALTNIEASQDSPAARSFWWVAIGFAEALADRSLASEPEARQLCARIDLQIRRLLEGSRNVAERLMRDALYYVARAPESAGDTLREIKSTYKLPGLIPATDAPTVDARIESLLRRLRETVSATEELWNKFCAGSTGVLNNFVDNANNCAALTAEIGHTDLKRLGQGLGAIAKWLHEKPARHGEAVAMEVATAILLLQKAQENFRRLGMDFAQQVDLMVARLHGCIAGKAADSEDDIPLLDEMTRRAQEKLLIGQVAREIQSSLGQIEQALDAFFRDPEKKQDLAQVDGPLKQVSGALTMLGHDSALQMLAECSNQIRRFAQPDYTPVQEDFEVVAQHLSMLGFFVDSLQHGTADFDTFSRNLQGESIPTEDEQEEFAVPEPAATVEAQLEQQKKDTQALVEALKEKPEDAKLKDELKLNLQALQKDADLVADRQLGETAKAALSALSADAAEAPAALDAALASLKPVAADTPAPSAETLQLAQSSVDEVDAELLAIFIEEAHEVLGTIADHLEILKSEAHNTEALTTIRRSTHTLKGSGRMVGLKDFGEVAWAIEQTLNQWLRQEIAVTPEILELIDQEHAVFTAWVDHLENRRGSIPNAAPLIALADRLRGVEAPDDAPASAIANAPASSAQIIQLPTAADSEPAPAEVIELQVSETPFSDAATDLDSDFTLSLDDLAPADETLPLPTVTQSSEALTIDGPSHPIELGVQPAVAEDISTIEAPAPSEEGDFAIAFDLDMPDTQGEALPLEELAEPSAQDGDLGLTASFDLGEPGQADSALDVLAVTGTSESYEEAEAPVLTEDSDFLASFEMEAPEDTAVEQVDSLPSATISEPCDIADPAAEATEVAGDAELALAFDMDLAGETDDATTATKEPESVEPAGLPTPDASKVVEPSIRESDMDLSMSFDLDTPEESEPAIAPDPLETIAFEEDSDLVASFNLDAELEPPAEITTPEKRLESPDSEEAAELPELSELAGDVDIAPPIEDADLAEMPELTETVELTESPKPETTSPSSASPTLYDIFREEAAGHMKRLAEGFSDLEHQPQNPTAFEMVRAAHTLGGIAATVGLMPINKVAITLEHALLRRDNCPRPDSIEGLETVRQAIICLEDMFVSLAEQRSPDPQPAMVEALEEIYQHPLPAPEALVAAEEAESADSAEVIESEQADESNALTPAQWNQVLPQLKDELDEQLLPIFLEEAQDIVRNFSEQLRSWRSSPNDGAPPRALARLLHTFKGSARMAGAMNLGEATHTLEARVEEILHAGDVTLPQIEEVESGCDILVQITERLQNGEPGYLPALVVPAAPAASTPAAAETTASSTAVLIEAPSGITAPTADAEAEQGAQRATLRVRADLLDRLVNEAGELSISRARIEGEMRGLKVSLLDLTESVIRLRRQLREIEIQAETQMQAHVVQTHATDINFDPLELDRFTRFQELTRFMAESVNDVATLQQNLLKNLDDANAALVAQARLNRSLQQELMGVRMIPFASQSDRLYRIVRQTAKETGKRANLDIRGGQVEIDRSVLDKMLAPLEHMLRNSLTHGIETREERVAKGKQEIGEILLSLQQEGNEIILSMTDDGGGLNPERIRARAESNGLLQPGEDADEAKLFDFIFHPGFSTASQVTQIAGRGVGMDVVRTEVASLGGRIEIDSKLGQGTTFRLYLPLTLAVTQTLLVRVGAHIYAIPSTMIEQVQEVKEKALQAIQEKGRTEWMGHLYPLHFLPNLLGDAEAKPEPRRQYWILLLRSGTQRVAIQVDELQGNHEVVVKNIGPQLARVVGIAGATVLGDGQVVLILNPVALASRSGLVGVARNLSAETAVAPAAPTALPTVMVVDDSLTVRKITGRLLAREGYQVLTAKDGVDALEQLLETIPDVLLSDVEMPRMDGFDLLRNIRADNRLNAIPVIMITSRTAEKHRNYALEMGASEYLGKPYDEDKLLGLIAGFVKAKRAS